MAWLATAFYIPLIIALGFRVPRASIFWETLVEVISFILLACLVSAFVFTQFRLRQIAADEIVALTRLVNDFCKNADNPDFEPIDVEIVEGRYWPGFVQKEINDAKGKGRLIFDKWGTDVVSYVAIGVSTIIALVLALAVK